LLAIARTDIGRAVFDCKIAAFDIAGVAEALPDSPDLSIIELAAQEQANQRHARLLRACRERPHRRAAEQLYDVAPFQLTGLHSLPLAIKSDPA
jgi:hypothetical protein